MPRRGSPAAARRPAMAPRPMAAHPAPPPPPSPPMAQPQQPSLLKQAAATAAGVAVGSAVGHAIGGAMLGGGSQPEVAMAQQPAAAMETQAPTSSPCQYHIDELLKCAKANSDISQCQYVANALNECRRMYNIQ